MKVAIWGSYAYGNYGDELMAVQFAVHLKRLGAVPVVYALSPRVANRHDINVSESADELLKDAVFCIFGGGSVLSGHKPTNGAYAESKREEYEAFRRALERYNCPLYLMSIGGDGPYGDDGELTDFRKRLLKGSQCKLATVRQKVDMERIRTQYGIDAHYHPDVLLSVGGFWNIQRERSDGAMHIGLNLPTCYRRTLRCLGFVTKTLSRGVVLHDLRTVRIAPGQMSAREGSGRTIPDGSVRLDLYNDPIEMLKVLSSLDLVITTKLHIGLTALALGVPYICMGRTLKSKAFLHSLGAVGAYWGDNSSTSKILRLVRMCLSQQNIHDAKCLFDEAEVERQRRASWGHLQVLEALCKQHASCQLSASTLP